MPGRPPAPRDAPCRRNGAYGETPAPQVGGVGEGASSEEGRTGDQKNEPFCPLPSARDGGSKKIRNQDVMFACLWQHILQMMVLVQCC